MRFTDVEESESESESEDEGEDEGKKKRFQPFGDLSVGGAILGIPVGIAVGIGGLLKDRRCFDGKNESDAWRRRRPTSIKRAKRNRQIMRILKQKLATRSRLKAVQTDCNDLEELFPIVYGA